MGAVRRELPHLITPSLNPPALQKALQENFDHLTGEVVRVNEAIGNTAPDPALIIPVIEESVNAGVGETEQHLADHGVGAEDGNVPPVPTNLRVQGGIGDWFIVFWDGVVNTSPVSYNVYADTVSGFTPAANTFVGVLTIPGGEALGSLLVKKFPSTHRLPNHDVNSSTTYFVKVSAKDGSGESAATSQVSVTPLKVDATTIVTGGTIIGNLIAGREILAGHIATGTITANEITGNTLDVISVNAGTLTAGTLNGLTFNGGSFRSTQSTSYVEMSTAIGPGADFIVSSARAGRVAGSASGLELQDLNLVARLRVTNGSVDILSDLKHTGNALGFYNVTPIARQSMTDFTDNSGGTPNDIIAAVSGSGADGTINNNFSDLATKMNNLLGKLRNTGIIS